MPPLQHPIPKHAIGDAVPDGSEYIARLRNPFLLARVEPLEAGRIRLHLWPPDYDRTTTTAKLSRVLSGLVEYYARATHQPLPHWTAAPELPERLPSCVLLDNTSSAWTGILQPRAPRLWEVTDTAGAPASDPSAVSISWLPAFPGPPPSFPDDTRATAHFYRQYTATEDHLPPHP